MELKKCTKFGEINISDIRLTVNFVTMSHLRGDDTQKKLYQSCTITYLKSIAIRAGCRVIKRNARILGFRALFMF